MGLKYELDEAPSEELASLYKESNGKYVLDVEDVVPHSKYAEVESKVNEFRTNNVALRQQLETVTKTSLKDKKPEEINIEQVLNERVSEMKNTLTKQIDTLSEETKKKDALIERFALSDAVSNAANEYGVLASALPDVMSRARESFTVVDGVAVPKDGKLDKDGKAYTVKSWINSLNESAPHLFAQSRGSGSQTSVKGKAPQGELSPRDKISKALAAGR